MTTCTRTLWTEHSGSWCDNCRTAFSYMPADGNCLMCGPFKLRPAKIRVEPTDVRDEEYPR